MKKAFTILTALVISGLTATAQLIGTKTIDNTGAGDYATFAAAITDLNANGVGSGGVTFNVVDGQSFAESPLIITATGTASNPIVFKKSGSGANPVILGTGGSLNNASSGGFYFYNAQNDAVVKIVGGDYITFDGIDVGNNPLNATGAAEIEYGFFIVKASATNGAKNIRIANSTITLLPNSKTIGVVTLNNAGSGTSELTINTDAGRTENIELYGLNITSYWGIKVRGYVSSTFCDRNIKIGTGGANTINFGAISGTNNAMGIVSIGTGGNFYLENTTLVGIAPSSRGIHGAYIGDSYAKDVKINNNDITISNTSTAQTHGIALWTQGTGDSIEAHHNKIHDINVAYNPGHSSSLYGLFLSSSFAIAKVHNNKVYNCVCNNNFDPLSGLGGNSGEVYNNEVYNNNILGNIYGLGVSGSNIHHNKVYNNKCTGSSNLLDISIRAPLGGGIAEVYNNEVYGDTLRFGTGILVQNSQNVEVNFHHNRVYNLVSVYADGSIEGIRFPSGASHNYNNSVSNLYANNSNNSEAVKGATVYVDNGLQTFSHNTIYLDGTSTQANHGSLALGVGGYSYGGNNSIALNNNIIVNNSTHGSNGISYCLSIENNVLAPGKGNNCFYAGTPGPQNLMLRTSEWTAPVYFNTDYKTIDDLLEYFGEGKQTESFTELPTFTNYTTLPYDLHLSPSVESRLHNGGKPVSGVITDFDGNSRSVSAPDIGAYEGEGNALSDVRTVKILSPQSGCELGNTTVSVRLHNNSSVPVSNAYVTYATNGGAIITESTSLAAWEYKDYTFSNLSPTLPGGINTIDASITPDFTDDELANNAITASFNNSLNTARKIAQLGSGTSTTSSGEISPVTNGAGSVLLQTIYTKEELNLAGVCDAKRLVKFGFYVDEAPQTALPNFSLKMRHTSADSARGYNNLPKDLVYFASEYAATAGRFDTLELNQAFDWNGTDNILVEVCWDVVDASSTGRVRLFDNQQYFGTNYSQSSYQAMCNYGYASSFSHSKPQAMMVFDTIPQNDLDAVSIDHINSGCGLADATITTTIVNRGTDDQSNFDISYSVNGGATITENYAGTLASNDTLVFTFSQQITFANGTSNLTAYTTLATDAYKDNDTTVTLTVSNSEGINTFPYIESFESGSGGWYTNGLEGSSTSWELGEPLGTEISSAGDGSSAWKTNLDGPYLDNEVSAVYSPCFNLSQFAGQPYPKLSLKINYHLLAYVTNRLMVEYSDDGGVNWNYVYDGNLPTYNYGQGWFDSYYGGWTGNTEGWVDVSYFVPMSEIDNLANVRFRVKLRSESQPNDINVYPAEAYLNEGAAFDAFSITPNDCSGLDAVDIYTYESSFCPGSNAAIYVDNSDYTKAYLWSDGLNNGTNFYATQTGDYWVTVTDRTGCSINSDTVTVTQYDVTTPTLSAEGATTFLQGGSVNLTFTNSEEYSNFYWLPNYTSDTTITVTTSGEYYVYAQDNLYGCLIYSDTILVTVNENPCAHFENAQTDYQICAGNSVIINSLNYLVNNNSYSYSISWSDGHEGQTEVAYTVEGNYSYSVYDSVCGLSDIVNFTIVVNTNPSAVLFPGSSVEICNGVAVELSSTPSDDATYIYIYDPSNNYYGGNVINATQAGEYRFIIGNDNCEITKTITVSNATLNTYFADADNDGFGNSAVSLQACSAPSGYVSNNNDCNDNEAAINPGATEVCDGLDNDCNGIPDDGLATQTYYQDADNDGFGNPAVSQINCRQPEGYVSDNTDCNDANAAIKPGATEVCGNGVDDNCNGQVDENCTPTRLNNASCGATIDVLSRYLACVAVPNATNYRYLVENISLGYSQTYESPTNSTTFRMSFLTGILPGTTYTIKVASKVNGSYSAYGAACSVTTSSIGTTQFASSSCGITVTLPTQALTFVAVPGATNYRFEVSNASLGFSQVFVANTASTTFRLSSITGLQNGQTYQVRIAAFLASTWGSYGNTCNLTVDYSSKLNAASCGLVLDVRSRFMACNAVAGATRYRYLITNSSLGYSQTYTSPTSATLFRMSFLTGITAATTYQVAVAAEIGGAFGSFGPTCSVTTPPVLRLEDETISSDTITFEAIAYPNPFTNNLTLSHNATGKEVNIRLLDMLGKVVYETNTTAAEITLGDGLAKGMYHISIGVGEERKKLKVLKE